ncbi:cyclic AMP-dependent transcription factor ATF-2 [Anopheles bellator]|uniref:cyclic AMP-dependent transcription factor ATF-2 n=1 Tax=Anopheles bellator TaxID=139047 RepID=UPI002647EE2C|nr:cyclic AMP-dependent transcription factor ATF-2 [Anopheles bellator]
MENPVAPKIKLEEGHCTDDRDQNATSEEQLKKHELSLNLEMPPLKGTGGLFTDQTPTPTRLIGKCEEVGLFEDLQKVNPFDETFRRAVESRSSVGTPSTEQPPSAGELTIPSRTADGETLHTPHVFPGTVEAVDNTDGEAKQRGKRKIQQSQRTTVPPDGMKSSTKRVVDILPKLPLCQPSVPTCATIPVLVMPPVVVPKILAPVTIGQSIGWGTHVKEKLKKHLQKPRNPSQETDRIQGQRILSSSDKGIAKSSSKPANYSNDNKESRSEDIDKHERWKAAAKRYRTRVKESQDKQHRHNIELEAEILRLRTELVALKHAHRNCSVTREMKLAVSQPHSSLQNTSGALESDGPPTKVVAGSTCMKTTHRSSNTDQPVALSEPQVRLITSRIINGHTMNKKPIFFVIAPGLEPTSPSCAVAEGSSSDKSARIKD